MTRLYEAQKAVFQRLQTDEALMSAINGIHDYVPDETDFPYIVFGRSYSEPYKTKTSIGERIELQIEIWSATKGKEETINIIKLMEAALTEELTVEDAFLISQEVKSREVLEEAIDLFHGTIVFEILLDLE